MYVLILVQEPLLRIKISFFLLPTCGDELIATPKIITFLPILLPSKKNHFLSNPITYPEYFYLSASRCFVNLTALKNFFSSVG